jgi:hypothetical protein
MLSVRALTFVSGASIRKVILTLLLNVNELLMLPKSTLGLWMMVVRLCLRL